LTTLAIVGNILRRITRDVRTLALIVILPLFFVLLYGHSFTGSYSGMKIVIVNQDNGLASIHTAELGRVTLELNLASLFMDVLDPETFEVIGASDSEAAQARVGQSGVRAALIFPISFSNAVANEAVRASGERRIQYEGTTVTLVPGDPIDGPQTQLFLDDGNPMVAGAILAELDAAMTAVLETQQTALTSEKLLQVQSLYDGEIRTLDFTAPGIIGFAMTLITVLLTAMAVVRERLSGTLTRVLIAPVGAWQVALAYTAAFTLIALLQAAELFVASFFLFGIRFVGSPLLVAWIVIVFAMGLQGIATLMSTLARNEAHAMQFVLFLVIPSIMLSGVFWPLEAMPSAIRPLSYAMPLTYANTALRRVMLTGSGLPDVRFELIVLGGIAVGALLLSIVSMRRQAYTA
jgi:ABC-2 type transport system permease protein